ncbi:MAG: class I SAM-dependent methyltransferase [Patescibacteria group bacterium]
MSSHEVQPRREPFSFIRKAAELFRKERPLTFEAFAKTHAYVKVNETLIGIWFNQLPNQFSFLDVAGGTGLVAKILKKKAELTKREGLIIGVDPNKDSLAVARKTIHSTKKIFIEFIEGLGQNLGTLLKGKIPGEKFDGASIHDAIHEIEGEGNKIAVLNAIADMLKKGGIFSLNSSFTTESMDHKSRLEWGRWRKRAADLLKLKRNKQEKPIEVHTPDEYVSMVEKAGFVIEKRGLSEVSLNRKALEAISLYPTFIEGFLKGFFMPETLTMREKSNALIEALKELKIKSLRRNWFELVARKV